MTAPDNLQDQIAQLPTEELRFALVLNGGVSLAVWMGGVAHEIDRLTRATPGSGTGYGPVLAAARTTARVDVISGTSAGGINGAALALAQANRRADLRALRTLWAEQGRMEQLLRRPFQGKPTSMLRGDDYFLPELRRAMKLLAHPYEKPEKEAPIDLTLTTTLLKGAENVTVDDFGERIPQRIHAGTFSFCNLGENGEALPGAENIFGEKGIESTARALALAARCTASFPFAFEPSFVPVGEEVGGEDPREDMRAFASWADGDQKLSRYAVDGGLLANTPLPHALDAIARRQADGPVRRALLMVFPHAPREEAVPPDTLESPPGAAGSLAGVLGALLAQGSRSFVEEVDNHNEQAAEWQGSRKQVLDGFGDGDPLGKLYSVLGTAWPQYRHIRIRYAARGLARRVGPLEQWSYERVRSAAEQAQRRWAFDLALDRTGDPPYPLPYVPRSFDWNDEAWHAATLAPENGWRWGDSAASGIAESAAAVLRAALSVTTQHERDVLSAARQEVGLRHAEIRAIRREIDAPWETDAFLKGRKPNTDYWTARIVAYEAAMGSSRTVADDTELLERLLESDARTQPVLGALADREERSGERVWRAVQRVLDQLIHCEGKLQAIADRPAGADEISGVRRWTRYLFGERLEGEPESTRQRLLLRLLALDAGTRLLADGIPAGGQLPVQLGELSLRAEHPWAKFSVTPDDKAAGLALARFGGFLKRSWRMNDWTWGRLDAVTMLCQTVLDPQRLQRIAAMTEAPDHTAVGAAMFAQLKRSLYGTAKLPEDLAHLEKVAEEELLAAVDPERDCRHLPGLAAWAALPLQAEIILEELPVLKSAVEVDLEEGAGRPTRGTRFLLHHEELLGKIGKVPAADGVGVTTRTRFGLGCQALQAFDAAGIGREELAEETGSNALIRTVSNAAGVLATVIDADAARCAPAIRPVTSAVRGAVMLPHWIVAGLAGGGTMQRFLASLGLVLGGVLLVLSLLGVLGGFAAAAGLVGGATLLAAFGYAALKTGSLLHAAALLAPVVPLAAFAVHTQADTAKDAAGRLGLVAAGVIALYVLANLPWPIRSPFGLVVDRSRSFATWWRDNPKAVRTIVATVAGIAAVASGGYAAWRRWGPLSETTVERLQQSQTVAVLFALVVLVGATLAFQEGRQFRSWHPDTDRTEHYPRGTGEVTGAFHRVRVDHPAGVAASWAAVYGLAFLVLAWVLYWLDWADEADAWRQISFWWLAGIGVLLCLVAPVAVTRKARRQVLASVRRNWPPIIPPPPPGASPDKLTLWPDDAAQQLAFSLLKYDVAYYYLLRGPHRWWERVTGTPKKTQKLTLTRQGRRLLASMPVEPVHERQVPDQREPGETTFGDLLLVDQPSEPVGATDRNG